MEKLATHAQKRLNTLLEQYQRQREQDRQSDIEFQAEIEALLPQLRRSYETQQEELLSVHEHFLVVSTSIRAGVLRADRVAARFGFELCETNFDTVFDTARVCISTVLPERKKKKRKKKRLNHVPFTPPSREPR